MILRRSAKSACRFFKRFRRETSANALILTAFGMPMVIGGGGFAIDFAQYYLWKRELQYASDQAALAAAWELANNPNSEGYVDRGIMEFNANEAVTKDFNTTPEIAMTNYAGEVNNAVRVDVSATRLLPFTSYFTGNSTTVAVYSQAAFTGGLVTTECLKAVDPEAGGSITFNGNPVFSAGCGIAALSTSSRICIDNDDGTPGLVDGECTTSWTGEDAIEANGTPTIDAGTIVAAGTIDDEIEELTDDIIVENFDQLYDQYADLTPPIDKVTATGSYTCKSTGKGKKNENASENTEIGVATAGIYEGGLTVKCDTTFQSGIYVIKGGELSISGNYNTIGSDVMFILTDGAGIKINGTSQNGGNDQINLQGITYDTLINYGVDSGDAERMTNMLVYEDPASPGHNPSGSGNGDMMNGTSDTWISGTIYLPKSTLTLAGTANVANICLSIIANKVTLSGTTNLTSFCPEGTSHEAVVFLGTVRLVA